MSTNSDQNSGSGMETLVYLNAEDIVIPEETNVRPWSAAHGDTDEEMKAIEEMAETIGKEGQIQAVRVVEDSDGNGGRVYKLIAGRRRVKAVQLHNLQLDENRAALKVKAVVASGKVTKANMHRQAALENIQRASISPMDFMQDIAYVRGEYGWKGAKGTKKVAEYFMVSPAQITQHEKLSLLSPDVQAKVHRGELTKDAAFALVKSVEEAAKQGGAGGRSKQEIEEDVLVEAEVLQRQEMAAEGDAEAEAAVATGSGKRKAGKKVAKQARGGKAGIKAKHIKAAAREKAGVQTKRNRAEVLEWFGGLLKPEYGHPNGAVHMFVHGVMDFADGKIGARALTGLFEKVAVGADKGKAEVVKPAKPAKVTKVITAAPGKVKTRAAKKAGKKMVKAAARTSKKK